MTTIDEEMNKSRLVHEYTKDMIEMSDINVIPHYHFENLEWMIAEEVKDWIEKHPINIELSKEKCEFICRDICKYVFAQREKEKTDFFLYHLPEFIADLYHKINIKDETYR